MKKNAALWILIVLAAILLFSFTANATSLTEVTPEEYQLNLYKAKVVEIVSETIKSDTTVQVAKVKILNRDKKGTVVEITNTLTGNPAYDIVLKKGTRVTINVVERDGELSYFLNGYEKSGYLIQITVIFLLLVLIFGGIKGIKSIVALTVTVLLVIVVLIPLLLKGYNPILLSVAVCAASTVVTMLIVAGFTKKSLSAIIGTTFGLIAGGTLAYIYGLLAKLTGFSSSDAQMLNYLPYNIKFDFRGLLFAGIIIGALGAAMDVAISIASSMTEIQKEKPTITMRQLFKAGMNIGKDIMGTMTNTLILAYTGSTLSTMLIFVGFKKSPTEIFNLDSVATEIVRAIAGSTGLLFAIPFTALAYIVISKYGNLFLQWKSKKEIEPKQGEVDA